MTSLEFKLVFRCSKPQTYSIFVGEEKENEMHLLFLSPENRKTFCRANLTGKSMKRDSRIRQTYLPFFNFYCQHNIIIIFRVMQPVSNPKCGKA